MRSSLYIVIIIVLNACAAPTASIAPEISTPKNERSIFIAADGKTVYFASNGYGGKGGLDILKTTLNEDGTFDELYNLGEPFNTKDGWYSDEGKKILEPVEL